MVARHVQPIYSFTIVKLKFMKNLLRISALFMLLAAIAFIVSCKKDDKKQVIAGFTYKVDDSDFLTVKFTNTSQDYAELSWNFGDGSPLVSDTDPTHTFPSEGSWKVKLTATDKNGKDEDISEQTIVIADPDKQLTALAGTGTKGWKLLRVVNGNTWPLEVGPYPKTNNEVWWALGRGNDDIAKRPCTMNDEWIFSRDGKMTYDSHGDFWAEGGVFLPKDDCFPSDAAHLTGEVMGADYTAFGDGTHDWAIENNKLTVTGLGAFIGLQKIGTNSEVHEPQQSVTYDILKLDDSGTTDTLVIESKYNNASPGSAPTAYWKILLVHYENASDEPPIPEPKPTASFSAVVNSLTVTISNTSTDATSYSWDFGDGNTSTETNPTHTYASSGEYTIKLTASNSAGDAFSELFIPVIDAPPMSADQLVGGPWRVRNAPFSVFVGPGLGNSSWWQVKPEYFAGTDPGAGNDWSCMPDDEFIFTAGGANPGMGSMEYKTNGTARNDSYFGSPNGCWTDAQIEGSPGAAFGSGTHSYEFFPASVTGGRPIIKLTNGPNRAAFIGFYKGFYGGENVPPNPATNPWPEPNLGNTTNQYEVLYYYVQNGKEVMAVSVDISDVHDGSKAWTMVMTR